MSATSRKDQLLQMLEQTPEDSLTRYMLAMEYKSTGDMEDAIAVFRELEQRDPDYVPTYLQLGQVLTQLDREEEAKQVYRVGIGVANKVNDLHAAGEMSEFLDMLE